MSDGIIAVGYSQANSFKTGDWAGIAGNGNTDAIIVKYDNNGNVVWKKNFGGSDNDGYGSVTAVLDGIIAVGNSYGFNTGDWTGIEGKGYSDAIIVKYEVVIPITVFNDGYGTASSDYTNAFAGTTVTLTATPNIGYKFKKWVITPSVTFTDGTTANNSTAKFIMPNEAVTATATFELIPVIYSITVQNDGHGIAKAQVSYVDATSAIAGTEVTLTASPYPNYQFDHWEVIEGGIDITDDKFTMPAQNVTMRAYFKSNDGVEQWTIENGQWTIYPNPTNGILHIVSTGASTQALPLQVYNIAGQSVGANLRVCPNDNDAITIDISHLANGLYFLKVGNKTVKIIKE